MCHLHWAVGRCRTPASTASQKAKSREKQTHRKPTCIAACLITTPTSIFSTTPASTALQKAPSRRDRFTESPHAILLVYQNHNSRQHSLTESPLFLPAPTTESPHENPPAQPHRKPNPERDRLTISPHVAVCFFKTLASTASQKAHCFFRHSTRQHSLTESPLLLPAPATTALQPT